ncbi:MAG: hypothetical protein ACLPWD_00770 [Methanobacterium sp.]
MNLIRDKEISPKVRLCAMAIMLDRGHGKAAQININYEPPPDPDAKKMNDTQLLDQFDSQLRLIQPFVESVLKK